MEKACKTYVVPVILLFLWGVSCADYYSTYGGKKLTQDQVEAYRANGTLANCTNVVAPCDKNEGRRINGTCNNLAHPSRGAARTPYYRLLTAVYKRTSDTVFDPKPSSCSASELPLARVVRNKLLADGRVADDRFTHCVTHFAVFFATDITNTQDTTNYAVWRPYCCEEKGKSDPACAPNYVPFDDYVHRFSGIRCLNMTKPLTFQTSGCLAKNTTPLRIVDATPLIDLSPVYGNVDEPARRTLVNGTLRLESVNGTTLPPTRSINLLLGVNFIGIVFMWRFHNHIALKLAEQNPCWTDEQIFVKAREINIAVGNQIYYYELMGTLLGVDNLVNDGILMDSCGFRDVYDSSLVPQISLEFPVALRAMHKMQDGLMKFYDTDGVYLNQSFPMVNLTTNINFIRGENHMAYITQGCFRQPTGKVDDLIVDPDLLNLGLASLQKSNDILTNDLAKDRHFGLRPYVDYRKLCFGDDITSFEQLKGIIPDERIEALKEVYDCVQDIDLLAGIWTEYLKEGAAVTPTFYCIVTDQLSHNMKSDRFWFERKNSPNALTYDQLSEVKKISVARILCDIGDSVTQIQPRAFEQPSESNELTTCDQIDDIDYSVWADPQCQMMHTQQKSD